ncbi:MAG: MFS transporter [Chloroflexi bacterium RBG_16_56_11]|nr:MAG: MFS transporter [Chloroflexi bacterium RBG_16_56_11]
MDHTKTENVKMSGSPAQGLLGATLGFFIGFAAVSLFGPTAKLLKAPLELSPVQVGLLVATPMLSGSLARIPFGAWVDTTGGKKPFLWLLGISAVGMAGLLVLLQVVTPEGLTPAYFPLVLGLGFLAGFGIATFSVGIAQTSYWFPQRRQGWALGAYAGFGNMAPGLFAWLIPIVIGLWTITGAYTIWLIFLVVGTIVYAIIGRNAYYFQLCRDRKGMPAEQARKLCRERGQELFPGGGVWHGLATAAKLWQTWFLVALYFTTFGGFLALTAWFPTFWSELFGLSLGAAGALTMLYSVLASLIRVPGGLFSDRVGGELTVILAVLVMMAGALVIALTRTFGPAVTGAVIMALGMGVGNAGVFKLVPRYLPRAMGGASGWVGGIGAFGGFAIPPLLGLFIRNQGDAGYSLGFVTFVGLAAVSLVLAYVLKRTYRTREAQEEGISTEASTA